MRVWHLFVAVALVAVVMTLARDPMTRVMLLVLGTGAVEVALGVISCYALFQTVGAMGEARDLVGRAGATAATLVVLVVTTAFMSGWLFVGVWLVHVAV